MKKVLFAHKTHPIEPLGIGYITSSIARGGHESKMILTPKDIDEAVKQISQKVSEYNPDIFAQSIIFGSHLYAAELNKKVKARHPNLITILGGPAGTFTPELIERGFDVVCRYEGEDPFLEFCNALDKGEDVGNIPNIWVKVNTDLYHTKIRNLKEILDIDDPRYKEESGFDPDRIRFVNATRNLLQGDSLGNTPAPNRKDQ